MKKIIYLCIYCLLLSACVSSGGYSAQKNIHEVLQGEFKVQKYHTSTFTLYGLLRPARGDNKSLHIYIEGDGFTWVNRNRPSKNPTPADNITRELAQYDPSDAAVLYLARPCQYVKEGDMRMCAQKFWTSHRLAPEVITALNEAVSKAKEYTGAESLSIVGYSGGGGAAVLVAAQRRDVAFLGSVAGLLDHVTWTNWHKVSPLHGSLNPVDIVHLVKNIPQLHVSSGGDKTMPPSSQARYCKELLQAGGQTNACIEFAGIGHAGDWYRVWDYGLMP